MFRISGPGLMVFIIAFVVAVIFAANQNDVVGWVVAIIAGFWLALASFVVFSIQKAAKKAGAKLNEAQNAFNARRPGAVVGQPDHGGTRLVERPPRSRRGPGPEAGPLLQDRPGAGPRGRAGAAKGEAADQDTIRRALETIEITATNARDMIKSSGGTDEPVTGTIID